MCDGHGAVGTNPRARVRLSMVTSVGGSPSGTNPRTRRRGQTLGLASTDHGAVGTNPRARVRRVRLARVTPRAPVGTCLRQRAGTRQACCCQAVLLVPGSLAYLQNSSLPQPGRGMPHQACFPGFVVSRVVVLQLDYDHWIHLLDSRPTLLPEW